MVIPLNIFWDITGYCNLNCIHCGMADYNKFTSTELSFEQIKCVIRNINSSRSLSITFSGGEPLIKKHFIEIIDGIKKEIPNAEISMFTNGLLLSKYCIELLDRNVNVLVSIDGADEKSHDIIRGKGAFEKTMKNLVSIIEAKKRHTDTKSFIALSYTISSNGCSGKEILDLALGSGADLLNLSYIANAGSALKNKHVLPSKRNVLNFIEEVFSAKKNSELKINAGFLRPLVIEYLNRKYNLDLKINYKGCNAMTCGVVIRRDGIVIPCRPLYPESPDGMALDVPAFNLLEKNISEFLESGFAKNISERKNPGRYEFYFPCSECRFAGSYCDPCWINNELHRTNQFNLCSEVYYGSL